MPSAYLQWVDKSGQSKVLHFDVVKSEQHNISTFITEHPVESGADIADHVRSNLDTFTLEGFVTNAPISGVDKTKISQKIGDYKGLDLTPVIPEYQAPLAPTPGAVFGAIGGALSSLLNGKKQYNALLL